jgi:hypothetical protein
MNCEYIKEKHQNIWINREKREHPVPVFYPIASNSQWALNLSL